MTNLQAMQDQRLQDLIYQVEQLERLQRQVGRMRDNWEQNKLLDIEIEELRIIIRKYWRELLEE